MNWEEVLQHDVDESATGTPSPRNSKWKARTTCPLFFHSFLIFQLCFLILPKAQNTLNKMPKTL